MIPSTTPNERDRRKAMGMHISECRDYCSGFYPAGVETYVCICWCHKERSGE